MLELPSVNGTFFLFQILTFLRDVCTGLFAQSQKAESTAVCIHGDKLLIGLKRRHISENVKQEIQTINSLETHISKCLYKIWVSFFQTLLKFIPADWKSSKSCEITYSLSPFIQ